MIQSHDFASTYVGTPFYMSPEICAAEKYTLKSDIWSLGCIIYELCSREPPFNAKSHFQLVQKIKEGKISPLPAVYSAELVAVIKDCLKVNPDRRPDTATLLNLPVVRLMRKEKEVVELGKILKAKEDSLNKRLREMDQKIDVDKTNIRQEIDASLRREWEVKARLEIDRLVAVEIEQLQKKFEQEVQTRVEAELQAQKKTVSFSSEEPQEFSSSVAKSDYPHSSIGTFSGDGDDEFPSTTDITDISAESPELPGPATKKSARTPFGRAQTMFVGATAGTPMDIEMASPSPMAIASLSLSPRRQAAAKAPSVTGNIFAAAVPQITGGDPRWDAAREVCASDSESEDEILIPSPTRMIRSSKNPFTSKQRQNLTSHKTVPANRLKSQPSLPPPSKTLGSTPNTASNPDLQTRPSSAALRERCVSPNRRQSKIPSAANLGSGAAGGLSDGAQQQQQQQAPGLTRKASTTKDADQVQQQAPALMSKVKSNSNIRGRTLVELQQARAGGRPISGVFGSENVSPKRPFKEHVSAHRGTASEPVAVWDPERDEMPSPFLVRRKPVGRV